MPRKNTFTREDEDSKDAYLAARSKACGNLHERMKWLIQCSDELGDYVRSQSDQRLQLLFQTANIAIVDLETEVSYTKAAKPPYGTRPRDPSDPRSHLHADRP